MDEHVRRHTPYGNKYVTIILDLTPVHNRSGPSRLLDMVPGRSKRVFKTRLASQPHTWRSHIEIAAMDGFTGFKSATAEQLPDARAVMDPFHVVHLAGDALDECRRRIQQELHHRRGRATDPLYKARRMLYTHSCLLTPRQQHQLLNLFSGEEHVALEVTWSVYQNIIDAYRDPNKIRGKALMEAEINTLTSTRVPRGLTELITLGRTLKRRAGDILAYFDHPHTSNGPTEAINGRLAHLRGPALGFRSPTHYITRALLETGGFRPQLHPQLSRAPYVLLVARPLNPSWTDSRGNLYICGNCEGRAVDNGLLADMLDSSCMRNIKAGAAGGIVEVIPDNPLIVVGQQPWVLRSL